MYAIDINLLRDRPELGGDSGVGPTGPAVDNTPIILGGIAAAVFLGLVIVGAAGANFWTGQLKARQEQVEGRLAEVAPQLKKLAELKQEEANIQAETQALTTIFNQVKPWSALLQDVAGLTPKGLQITSMTQLPPPPPPAPAPVAEGQEPPPPPPPVTTTELTLDGFAESFSDVNDFVLLLQRKSPYLVADSTRLITADRLADDPASETSPIKFQIKSMVNDVPASELLQALEENGAAGLTSRIKFLQQRGVVTP